MPHENYMIRITYPYVRLKGFTQRLLEVCDRLAIYQHEASRIHIHAYLERCSVTTETMKNWIRQDVDEQPTKDMWSFKTKTREGPAEERFLTYMSKGKLEPVLVKGFTQEQLNYHRSQWVDLTTDSGTPAESSKDTVTIYRMARELAQYIDTRSQSEYDLVQGRFISANEAVTMREVVLHAIRIHNKYQKSYTDFCIQRLVQTAMGLCNVHALKEQLVEKCIKRLSPL